MNGEYFDCDPRHGGIPVVSTRALTQQHVQRHGDAGATGGGGTDSPAAGDTSPGCTTWHPDYSYSSQQAQQWRQANEQSTTQAIALDANGKYTVQFGDSLSSIAERYLQGKGNNAPSKDDVRGEVQQIVRDNQATYGTLDCSHDLIKTGWKLVINGVDQQAAAPPPEAPAPQPPPEAPAPQPPPEAPAPQPPPEAPAPQPPAPAPEAALPAPAPPRSHRGGVEVYNIDEAEINDCGRCTTGDQGVPRWGDNAQNYRRTYATDDPNYETVPQAVPSWNQYSGVPQWGAQPNVGLEFNFLPRPHFPVPFHRGWVPPPPPLFGGGFIGTGIGAFFGGRRNGVSVNLGINQAY